MPHGSEVVIGMFYQPNCVQTTQHIGYDRAHTIPNQGRHIYWVSFIPIQARKGWGGGHPMDVSARLGHHTRSQGPRSLGAISCLLGRPCPCDPRAPHPESEGVVGWLERRRH